MTDSSIGFQALSQESTAPLRQSFRVPVSSKDNILAVFKGRTYSVANLSATGISICAESCLEFDEDEAIDGGELWIGTRRCVMGLSGRVIHCSVHASGSLQFGIVWENADPETRAGLLAVLNRVKAMAAPGA